MIGEGGYAELLYWITLTEALLLTVYTCLLYRQSFAVAWALAREYDKLLFKVGEIT